MWTRDLGRAHRMAAALDAGTVWINTYNLFDPALSFGGTGESGLGRDLGEEGLRASSRPRASSSRSGGVTGMLTVHGVSGPIAPEQLGVTLPHEHVYINMTRTTPQDGYLAVEEEMLAELALFRAAGGSTLIDLTNGEL